MNTPDSAEFRTYIRELPALVAAGAEGRYALIHGETLFGTWDTLQDALQAGYDRFGLDTPFATQPIYARDLKVATAPNAPADLAAVS